MWTSTDEFVQTRRFKRFEPAMDDARRRMHQAGWSRAIGAALAWARS
jgi:glycerol kinase